MRAARRAGQVAATRAGRMPHVHGPSARCDRHLTLKRRSPCDAVTGTRFGFVAFAGWTLLILVGRSTRSAGRVDGLRSAASCEVIALTDDPWSGRRRRRAPVRQSSPALDASTSW